jgi:hypothetical protein
MTKIWHSGMALKELGSSARFRNMDLDAVGFDKLVLDLH